MSTDIAKLIETADFRAAEDAAWLASTCDTSSVDGSMEYYDQVVAMSQGMINYALEQMHKQNPALGNFDGSNALGSGLISGELDPARILIHPASSNTVSWWTTFKTGTLVYKPENGDEAYYPIDGWCVETIVPLEMRDYSDKPGDSDMLKAYNAKQRAWAASCFQRPGDYRLERLYAKFADARWGDLRVVDKSFVIDGVPQDYEVWRLNSKTNMAVAIAFEATFKQICLQRQADGLTTVGSRFNLDDPPTPPPKRRALYPPVTMVHQGFPYRMKTASGAPEAWKDGVKSFADPGTRNCLLYCENVDNRPMKQRWLAIDGNFSTFGSTRNPSSRIEGTFSLSHQLFFERFLLPALQPFVQASEIFPLEPTVDFNDGTTVYQPYSIGSHGDSWPHPGPEDKLYAFKLVVDPEGDGKTQCYQASLPNGKDTPLAKNGGESTKLYSVGTPVVTVRWQRGGTRITINAKTVYRQDLTTGNHEIVNAESHQLVPAVTWVHLVWTVTWSMTIDAIASDGDINFKLSTTDNPVKVEVSEDWNGWHWSVEGTTKKITDTITSSIGQHITTLEETLKSAFNGQLAFHYPGYGQLKFFQSMFNDRGDFLASIKYADMPPPDPNNPFFIPAVNTPLPAPVHIEPTKGESGGTSTGGGTRLTWNGNSPLQASPPIPTPPTQSGTQAGTAPAQPPAPVDRRITISIVGTNTTQNTQYLSKITLDLSGNAKTLDTLLAAAKFVLSGGSSSQDQSQVEIKVEASADTTKLTKGLENRIISPHMTNCKVVLTPESGNIIAVPPGGWIKVTLKSVSGAKRVKNYDILVTEDWVNAEGERTPGAIDFFKARVPFTLT